MEGAHSQPAKSPGRNFLLLWQGQVVSHLGTQLFQVIVILILSQVTNSPQLVGLWMLVSTLPAVLLGPYGGVLADRYSRRLILITGDVVRGLLLVGMALLLGLHSFSVTYLVAALFLFAAVDAVVDAVWRPASIALIPQVVSSEELPKANSLREGSFQICTVVAQFVAGLLFRIAGAPWLMLLDGISYLYGAVSSAFVQVVEPQVKPNHPGNGFVSFKRELREGLSHIHSNMGMRTIFYTMAFFQLLMVPMLIVFPFYVQEQLRAGPSWYGFLLAAAGIGTFIGYGIAGAASKVDGSAVIIGASLAMSLSLASLAAIRSPWIALLAAAMIGMTDGFVGLKLLTILQRVTPPELSGRVFGLLLTVTQGLAPLAMAITSVVAGLLRRNIPLIYLVCGLGSMLLTMNIALRPECREFLGSGRQRERLPAPARAVQ